MPNTTKKERVNQAARLSVEWSYAKATSYSLGFDINPTGSPGSSDTLYPGIVVGLDWIGTSGTPPTL